MAAEKKQITPEQSGADHRNLASLPEVHASVAIPSDPGFWRRLFAFIGPAYMVSVGYMDPGNWATDIEGGARFNYQLIWVLLMSNLMAILLQTLSARLGIVTRRDLAQACRDYYPKPIALALWILCEVAIAACDLAEVLGTAIGLNLLFGIPLLPAVVLTVADVLLLLAMQRYGIRKLEAFILLLITTVGFCYLVELVLARPEWGEVAKALIRPKLSAESLYVALGMLGATVMPHNLYLHSALVQSRRVSRTSSGLRTACRYNLIDSAVALNFAFLVNAAILIMSAAVFFRNGVVVTELQQAHQTLEPLLGTSVAGAAFAIALICAGQSSTVTGTLAGQIVMEGFLRFRMRPWLRRMITRSIAVVPAVVVIAVMGDSATYQLLILSQVILSLQLPFAIIPLIQFTSDRSKMGEFTSSFGIRVLSWAVAVTIIGLNAWLLTQVLNSWIASGGMVALLVRFVLWPMFGAGAIFLVYLLLRPALLEHERRTEFDKRLETYAMKQEGRMYATMLVPMEVSGADRIIINHIKPLAKANGSRIILFHVADGWAPHFYGEDADSSEVREDREYLEMMAKELREEGLIVETRLGFGDPGDEIIKIAASEPIDLIAMTTHGHRFPQDVIYGSAVHKVRHSVTVPLLLLRVPKGG